MVAVSPTCKCSVSNSDIFFFLLLTFKIWISNGGLAEVLTVFARTDYTDDKVRGLCMLI